MLDETSACSILYQDLRCCAYYWVHVDQKLGHVVVYWICPGYTWQNWCCPVKQERLNQCWFYVGPASVIKHWFQVFCLLRYLSDRKSATNCSGIIIITTIYAWPSDGHWLAPRVHIYWHVRPIRTDHRWPLAAAHQHHTDNCNNS